MKLNESSSNTLRKRKSNRMDSNSTESMKTNETNQNQSKSQIQKLLQRLVFGLLMIFTFIGIIWAGHVYVWLLVVILQTLIFRELVQVRYRVNAEKNIPWFRSVQWCWFGVAMLYNYGDSLVMFLKQEEIPGIPEQIIEYLHYHTWVSFTLYALIFVMSVLSLKKGYYKYQMGQLTWTFVSIGMIVFQMKSVLLNILNGLFWLMFPAALVVCNDCFAYFCGKLFGRKFVKIHFLRLSPNKTWEGFIGAFFITLIFGFYFSAYLAQFPWLICRVNELHWLPHALSCPTPYEFQLQTYQIPLSLRSYIGWSSFQVLPIQLHSIVFGFFVSLIAPFGGFFASAIKRAYHLKDFDSVIPGHGGVMDRMDCQFITSLFTTVYYRTFIRIPIVTVAVIMNFIQELNVEDQRLLLKRLENLVSKQST